MKNKRNVIGIAVLCIAIAAIFLAGKPAAQSPDAPSKSQSTSDTNTKLTPKLDASLIDNAPVSGDFMLGKEEAPVTLIEYASMSCPHCAHFHNKVLPQLTKEYIETGKLRYILRQFPLNEPAFAGAMLVTCAGEAGGTARYYTFARVLFDAQNKWAFDKNFKESLKTFAEVGGINGKTFDTCMNDTKLETRILQARKDASEQLQIDSTPYIFLNGHPHKGDKSFKTVKAEIDALLREAATNSKK